MLGMAVKNLQTGAVPPIDDAEGIIGRILIGRHAYLDMISPSDSTIQLVDVMDLFEQSRTELVGGQPGLKAFLDRGISLVVGQIDALVLSKDVKITPGTDVLCEVTLIRATTGRRCFNFQQRLLRSDGMEAARVRVLMCCVDVSKGELVPVPDDSWAYWNMRLETLGKSPSHGNGFHNQRTKLS